MGNELCKKVAQTVLHTNSKLKYKPDATFVAKLSVLSCQGRKINNEPWTSYLKKKNDHRRFTL